jgi:lipase
VARLHVWEWGPADGEPLVCVHGVSGHGGSFAPYARRLPSRRVLAPDLRGRGSSTHEPPFDLETTVADLLETVPAVGADWIGFSFGGRVVLEVAAARPDLVRRAVLVDPGLHFPPGYGDEAEENVPRDVALASFDDGVDRFEGVDRPLAAEALRDHLVRCDDGLWRFRVEREAIVEGSRALEAPLPPLPRVPTLLILASESHVDNAAGADALRAELGELLDVRVVEGTHTIFWTALDEIAAAIDLFLHATPASSASA